MEERNPEIKIEEKKKAFERGLEAINSIIESTTKLSIKYQQLSKQVDFTEFRESLSPKENQDINKFLQDNQSLLQSLSDNLVLLAKTVDYQISAETFKEKVPNLITAIDNSVYIPGATVSETILQAYGKTGQKIAFKISMQNGTTHNYDQLPNGKIVYNGYNQTVQADSKEELQKKLNQPLPDDSKITENHSVTQMDENTYRHNVNWSKKSSQDNGNVEETLAVGWKANQDGSNRRDYQYSYEKSFLCQREYDSVDLMLAGEKITKPGPTTQTGIGVDRGHGAATKALEKLSEEIAKKSESGRYFNFVFSLAADIQNLVGRFNEMIRQKEQNDVPKLCANLYILEIILQEFSKHAPPIQDTISSVLEQIQVLELQKKLPDALEKIETLQNQIANINERLIEKNNQLLRMTKTKEGKQKISDFFENPENALRKEIKQLSEEKEQKVQELEELRKEFIPDYKQ